MSSHPISVAQILKQAQPTQRGEKSEDCLSESAHRQPIFYFSGSRLFPTSDQASKEEYYFWILLAISAVVYAIAFLSIIGFFTLTLYFLLALFLPAMLLMGRLQGNAVCLGPNQFPEVYTLAGALSRRMGLLDAPSIYIRESGGMLEVFAHQFLSRRDLVLSSDIFQIAYRKGDKALAFILAHELGRFKLKHHQWRWLLFPALFIPFLGQAYHRACTYSRDRLAYEAAPEEAIQALLILAAGKNLYRHINFKAYLDQTLQNNDFWSRLGEMLSSHPYLVHRIQAIQSYRFQASGRTKVPSAAACFKG